jgi:hypothetical protein
MKLYEYLGRNSPIIKEVGLEIEMEGRYLDPPDLNYWKKEHDGSLRGESMEYVLKTPVARDRVGPRLKYLWTQLEDHGAELSPSDRCGVHVHINCQDMTFAEVFRFISLYLVFEQPLTRWCGDDREGNLFCLRATDAEYLIRFLVSARSRSFEALCAEPMMRYSGINVAALGKFGTLEFRSLRTPKDYTRIDDWVRLLLRIRDKALEAESDADFVEQLSFKGALPFAKEVMGSHLDKIRVDDMEDMLMEGVRVVQNYAYMPTKGEPKRRSAMQESFVKIDPPELEDAREYMQERQLQRDIHIKKYRAAEEF